MGHGSKFLFPLPGRKHKPVQQQPPAAKTGPLTKAQKILGTGEINIDSSPSLSVDSKWTWESRSASGISISVSEATPSQTDGGGTGLGIAHEDAPAVFRARPERRWEEESEIIPRNLNNQNHTAVGGTTDASSLRRRQSSSTITSYYDKSKLPLSISQQTSNSAMAKGLPPKAHALLDMDGLAETKPKKKPTRLDLSSLLPRSKFSRHPKPDSQKGPVLSPESITTSPSMMSMSPDTPQPPTPNRLVRKPKKKATKESLRELPPVVEAQPMPQIQQHPPARRDLAAAGALAGGRHNPSKSTVNLFNLYDHYEQLSFADVLEKEINSGPNAGFDLSSDRHIPVYKPPLGNGSDRAFLSPFPPNGIRSPYSSKQPSPSGGASDMQLAGVVSPLGLISPHADSASISSRHTRTSKASKRTDRSLTDIDLQQNSVLALSSDSEDDSYEPSSKSSLAVPALSDGQTSPTSPRSAISQRSIPATPQDTSRPKMPKRTSFATNPQFLPIPEGAAAASPLKIGSRSSSILPNFSTKKVSPSLSHQMSRLSINTTSTSRTVSYETMQNSGSREAKAISMVPKSSPSQLSNWLGSADKRLDNFPTPPKHRANRPSIASQASDQPTPPLSPTSVDFYLQSHHTSMATFDARSTSSGKSLGGGAVKGTRRSSAASSLQDTSSGRFMAVTRQEEMLLAALRLKRARMREDKISEFEEDLDNEDHVLERETTNESSIYSSGMSRQSSMSTMRNAETGAGSLTARPHQQPQIRLSSGSSEHRTEKGSGRGQILLMMDRPMKSASALDTAEPSPDLSDFLEFDDSRDGFPMHYSSSSASQGAQSRKSSPGASAESMSGASTQDRNATPASTSTRAKPRGRGDGLLRQSDDNADTRTGTRRRDDRDAHARIPENVAEEEDTQNGFPRPDSPISPDAFPMPNPIARKKQVRLSAVGNYKPNVEAGWWDDSG
ncbi:hypothetical protein B0T26DRAFT_653446 [Lasiosphaeria miniovina]|uniref:Uncharacterized protein n=1 Tax=Lasiosphaeria miniovina TaxID=1954250 RepID=A0AA40DR31_9PEZI|nr:uncharacterized protein B0T26DRAFT_653446 [Lasiosphaeria miniovina]KAK0710152.1 hypothetical protein B0T26DRAFT_653446 [Lasiosphaeria miniovina]